MLRPNASFAHLSKLRLVAVLSGVVVLLWTALAVAFQPPPLRGHVVDTAGALTPEEARRLDGKLDSARQSKGFAVVVFITRSLEGETIEDVSYKTAKAWGVGAKGVDDGVVLVVAPTERKLRIETGKGVGGALTDLECAHIIRDTIGPKMKEGKTYAAVDAGTDRILAALVSGTAGGRSAPAKATPSKTNSGYEQGIGIAIFGGSIAFFLLLLAVVRRFTKRRGWSGHGDSTWTASSYDTSSSWSSSDSSWSSSDYSSSDSSYSGGGGDFGGGGSSGDY
jgi:uncharacterized protein